MKNHWETDHDEEVSDEGRMAHSNLKRSQSMISQLQAAIEEDDSLPAWVQAKLTSVFEDLSDVHGYIVGSPEEEQVTAEGKKKKGLWDNIWARRRAGKRPLRPGEKGYPKTLDIDEEYEASDESESNLREFIELFVEKKCKGYKKSPVGSPRQRSFCKRMCGMKKHNTGAATTKDPDSCINQSLRRWKCRCT